MTSLDLVTIVGSAPTVRVRPSQFNARTVAADGTLLLFNSYSGAFTGVPKAKRAQAEALLRRDGTLTEASGLAKYMLDRGFLVPSSSNELNKLRSLHGHQHYRNDRLELILLASEECNFRCVYCYETFPRGTMEPWVRSAVVALAETRIKELRSLDVSWFGGEPLLGLEAIREMCPRLQELARDNGVQFTSGMTTNGYLLSKDVFTELLGYGINSYQISLDGNSADHDCKRVMKDGGPSFHTIYKNLQDMRDVEGLFRITIRVNFDRDNLPNVREFLELLRDDFAQDSRFQLRFYPVGKWGGDNDEELDVCGTDGWSQKLALNQLSTEYGVKAEERLPWMQAKNGMGVCYAARPYNLLIGADGKIMKCTISLDQDSKNIVGKLSPSGVPELDLEKFAKWVEPAFEDDAQCKKCFYSPTCQGISCPKIRMDSGERPCPEEKQSVGPTLRAIWEIGRTTARTRRLEANA
jgi:uncharacterized protein